MIEWWKIGRILIGYYVKNRSKDKKKSDVLCLFKGLFCSTCSSYYEVTTAEALQNMKSMEHIIRSFKHEVPTDMEKGPLERAPRLNFGWFRHQKSRGAGTTRGGERQGL